MTKLEDEHSGSQLKGSSACVDRGVRSPSVHLDDIGGAATFSEMDVRIDLRSRPRPKRESVISSAARKMRRLDTAPFALDPRRFETPWPGFERSGALALEIGGRESPTRSEVDRVRRAADDYLTKVERSVLALREGSNAHVAAAEERARALVTAAKREAADHLDRARREAALVHAEAATRLAAAEELAAEWLGEARAERERILGNRDCPAG